MQTLESLKKRIHTASDLLSLVKTMKSLAAVNIRHFEQAAQSLEEYAVVVEQAWRVFLLSEGEIAPFAKTKKAVILAIGSDQGMCGQFNEIIQQHAQTEKESLQASGIETEFWVAGDRIKSGLGDAGHPPSLTFHIPSTLGGIHSVVAEFIEHIARWRYKKGVTRFSTVFNAPLGMQGYAPQSVHVLPLDQEWTDQRTKEAWPERCHPQFFIPAKQLLSGLFEQHLFVSLYGALARSLAAENAARLMAMQAAEKNIMDMRDTQEAKFRELRQNAITEELLDIVSGFEALTKEHNT
ncbi:F0F1 ATP synthase subunit gamma [Halodesulfovibrio aestuarii]|uniref:F0F1 ATP synthase subunit gamma n=1 Tax=Halodesulfovibrio aestuarii TaxID=126333 RepID=A0ABV4JSM2_9BACT